MKRSTVLVGLAAVALLVAAVAATLGLVAGGTHGSAASASPQPDSISVHGRWTIQVRTGTGKIVAQRRFENALIGPYALAQILARQKSVGLWRILLQGIADPPCIANGNPSASCVIYEPGGGSPSSYESNNLAVSYDSSGPAFVLSGSINASRTGQIESVYTQDVLCDPTVPPSTPCASGFLAALTKKDLSPPVAVQSGQQIAVTVRITFS